MDHDTDFCKQCGNKYTIVDSSKDIDLQIGGNIKKGVGYYEQLINKLLYVIDISNLIEDLDTNKLYQSPSYMNLSDEKKELLFNKIQSYSGSKTKLKKSSKTMKYKYINFCANCYYKEDLPPVKKIHTILIEQNNNSNVSDDTDTRDYTHLIDDPRLPIIYDYDCINDKCATKKDPSLQEAVVYTNRKNRKAIFICKVCKTQFFN